MQRGNYFYQVEFTDGKVIRREGVSKVLARAAFEIFYYEAWELNVDAVKYGKMTIP